MDMIDQITAQDAVRQYRAFTDRLNKIVRTMIESNLKNERLAYCYVTKWSFITSRNEISIVDIDAEIDDGGEERTPINISDLPVKIFPESWLWSDDWKPEFEKHKVLTEYRILRWQLENAEATQKDILFKRLPAVEDLITKVRSQMKDTTERLLKMDLEIPE